MPVRRDHSLAPKPQDNTSRIQELTKELKAAADSYYNTGIELMSNKEYDAKFDELRILEQQAGIKDGFTSEVGAETSSKLAKVTHQYEAKSLGKTKDVDELIAAQANYPKDPFVCLSWKCDGSTVQLTYEDGRLALAATRGDGKVGQDITDNAKYIEGIPQTIPFKGELTVRGEALMTYAEFERLNTDGQFANPRNLANATISAIDKSLLENRKIEFKAFELVHTEDNSVLQKLNSFSERLTYLTKLGFGVVPHERIALKDLKSEIKAWSEDSVIKAIGFPVDGLVVANDDCEFTKNLVGTEHHPNLMKGMAFKWQDETAQTVLRDIEWSPSRTGKLTPVAIFDTVDLCGTKVSRASLHNVPYVEALNLKIGDRITVYKANMIIPQIDENLDKGKNGSYDFHGVSCPCCKTQSVLVDKALMCPNEKCPEKELGNLVHFVSKHGMNIEGLSEKTLEQLIIAGLVKEPVDLYLLKDKQYELLTLEGVQEKSMRNLLDAVEKSKKADFEHFMYACGIEGIGRGQIKTIKAFLDESFPDVYIDYLSTLIDLNKEGFDFSEIEGFGETLAGSLKSFLDKYFEPTNPDYDDRFAKVIVECDIDFMRMPLAKGNDLPFSGKTFCITGSLENFANRDACVEFIENNGGKFVSGVSAKTDFLVNNDIASTSGKNKKAKDLGVPIITEKQLINAADGVTLPAKNKTQGKEK